MEDNASHMEWVEVTDAQRQLRELSGLNGRYGRFLTRVKENREFQGVERIQNEVETGQRLSQSVAAIIAQEQENLGSSTHLHLSQFEALRSTVSHQRRLIQATWGDLEHILQTRVAPPLHHHPKRVPADGRRQPNPLPMPVLDSLGPNLTSHVWIDPEGGPVTGGFSDTYTGVYYRENQPPMKVAIKQILFPADEGFTYIQSLHSIARETMFSLRVEHPNILRFLGTFYVDIPPTPVCLVSEWMNNGHALNYVTKTDADVATTLGILFGAATGLDFLHRQTPPIVHGDVKGENILITDDGRAVISDFGFARAFDPLIKQTSPSTYLGTLAFQSPERLEPETFGLTRLESWHPRSDVYSFGMTCWQLLARARPLHEHPGAHILDRILSGVRPVIREEWRRRPDLANVIACMQLCWLHQYDGRPSMSAVLQML